MPACDSTIFPSRSISKVMGREGSPPYGEGRESAVSAGEVLVANNDWIIQLVLFEEWLYRFPAVVIHGNANGRESVVPVFILELHVPRNLNFAAAAPSSPEVEQDYFPFVRG